MKSNKEDFETIRILDITSDDESVGVQTIEEDVIDLSIPDTKAESFKPLTPEINELIEGTYVENEQEREQKRIDEAKNKRDSKIKVLIMVVVILLVGVYTFFNLSSLMSKNQQEIVAEKVEFLESGATFTNSIKNQFSALRLNAYNYQEGISGEHSFKSKAEQINKTINTEIANLNSKKNSFETYKAEELYDIIYSRLNEAKKLANYQSAGGDKRTQVEKTNEYLVNEANNLNTYISKLKIYLTTNKIDFTEKDGSLIYSIDK